MATDEALAREFFATFVSVGVDTMVVIDVLEKPAGLCAASGARWMT